MICTDFKKGGRGRRCISVEHPTLPIGPAAPPPEGYTLAFTLLFFPIPLLSWNINGEILVLHGVYGGGGGGGSGRGWVRGRRSSCIPCSVGNTGAVDMVGETFQDTPGG